LEGARAGARLFGRKRELKLPWREAGPPNHHDDKVDLTRRLSVKNSLWQVRCLAAARGFGRCAAGRQVLVRANRFFRMFFLRCRCGRCARKKAFANASPLSMSTQFITPAGCRQTVTHWHLRFPTEPLTQWLQRPPEAGSSYRGPESSASAPRQVPSPARERESSLLTTYWSESPTLNPSNPDSQLSTSQTPTPNPQRALAISPCPCGPCSTLNPQPSIPDVLWSSSEEVKMKIPALNMVRMISGPASHLRPPPKPRVVPHRERLAPQREHPVWSPRHRPDPGLHLRNTSFSYILGR